MKKESYPGIEIRTIHDQMDDILRLLHTDATGARARDNDCKWYPHVDIYETSDELIVVTECAGVELADLEIVMEDKILTLKGVRKDLLEGKSRIKAHNMEITYGCFKRTVRIDIPIQSDRVHAGLKNGFLTLTIPKENQPPRSIPIDVQTSDE